MPGLWDLTDVPGIALHLHRTYRDFESPEGLSVRAPSRVFLPVQISHPRTGVVNPTRFDAILDTGAERTVIPLAATEYFEKYTPARLIKSTPGRLVLADGTTREDVPSFDIAMRFHGLAFDRAEGRGITVPFEGRRRDGSWRSIACFAFEFLVPKRHSNGDIRRFDQVILGMDVMRFWKVDLDGPDGRYVVVIDPDAG